MIINLNKVYCIMVIYLNKNLSYMTYLLEMELQEEGKVIIRSYERIDSMLKIEEKEKFSYRR